MITVTSHRMGKKKEEPWNEKDEMDRGMAASIMVGAMGMAATNVWVIRLPSPGGTSDHAGGAAGIGRSCGLHSD